MIAGFGGTAFGDIALVPAPVPQAPQGHPRRHRVVHVHQRAARLHPRDVRRNSARLRSSTWRRSRPPWAPVWTWSSSAARISARKPSSFCSVPTLRESVPALLQAGERLDSQHTPWKTFKHSCGAVEKFIAVVHRGGLRHRQPGAVLGHGDGPGAAQAEVRGSHRILGRRRGYAESAAVRDARGGACAGAANAARSFLGAAVSSSTRFTTSRPARPSRTLWR